MHILSMFQVLWKQIFWMSLLSSVSGKIVQDLRRKQACDWILYLLVARFIVIKNSSMSQIPHLENESSISCGCAWMSMWLSEEISRTREWTSMYLWPLTQRGITLGIMTRGERCALDIASTIHLAVGWKGVVYTWLKALSFWVKPSIAPTVSINTRFPFLQPFSHALKSSDSSGSFQVFSTGLWH